MVRLLAWFIPASVHAEGSEAVHRAQVVVAGSIATMIVAAGVAVAQAIGGIGLSVAASALVAGIAATVPWLLRATGAWKALGAGLCAALWLAALVVAVATGGVQVVPLFYLALAPAVATFVLGIRAGLVGMILSLLATIGLYIVFRAGGYFAVPVPPDVAIASAFRGAIVFSVALVLLAGAYDWLARISIRSARESEERYRSLVENAPVGVVSCDREGRILAVNPFLVRMLGSPSLEATRAINLMHFPPLVEAGVSGAIRRAIETGEIVSGDFDYTSKWEQQISLRILAAPMRDGTGEIVGAQGIVEDFSARLRLERQIRETQRLESLGLFAGGVAHDFNNVLVAILGNAELARDAEIGPASLRDAIDQIERAAERAAELAQQLLIYSGGGQFLPRPLDLNALAAEIASLTRVAFKNAELCLELPPELPLVFGDATQLRQVVLNLLVNAAEASAAGGRVTLRTRVPSNEGSECRATEPERVLLEVEDEGVGIDGESSARIFDPFFTTKKTGRGLGLAVVQGIVRAHGGTIEVVSTPGNTIFRVELPAAIAGAAHESDGVGDPVQGDKFNGGGRSVLVVDDDAAVRAVLRRRLEHAGMSVCEASDGARGEEIFTARPDAFDLVVLDLTMPGRGGEEVLRTLRRLRPSIPVVLISGYSTDSIATPLAADRRLRFLRKPFRGEDLLRAIGDLLAIP